MMSLRGSRRFCSAPTLLAFAATLTLVRPAAADMGTISATLQHLAVIAPYNSSGDGGVFQFTASSPNLFTSPTNPSQQVSLALFPGLGNQAGIAFNTFCVDTTHDIFYSTPVTFTVTYADPNQLSSWDSIPNIQN